MKHTHIHRTWATNNLSFAERRLIHEVEFRKPPAPCGENRDPAREKLLARKREDYKATEEAKLPADETRRTPQQQKRFKFLEELDRADEGLIQIEQLLNIKFGMDDDGGLEIIGTPDKGRVQNLLKNQTENGDGTYTLSTKVGNETIKITIDDVALDVLTSFAAQKINNLPKIAKDEVPDDPKQRDAFIKSYRKAALQNPSMLKLNDAGDISKFEDQYEQMAREIIEKQPSAIQYVMVEWATDHENEYAILWKNALASKPQLLEYLNQGRIDCLNGQKEYAVICRQAVSKDPKVVRFVKFTVDMDGKDQESIIALALKGGPEVTKLLPPSARKIAAKFKAGDLVSEVSTKEPTEDEKETVASLLADEFAGDIGPVEKFISMRPKLIHFIPDQWARSHKEELKTLWRAAVQSYPDVIANPKALPSMRKYMQEDAESFYGELVKEAVKKTVRNGERRDDGSALTLKIDPEWRRQKPDSFRALFINPATNKPVGDDTLLALLTVEGAREAFNTVDASNRNPNGYAAALIAALNTDSLGKLIENTPQKLSVLEKFVAMNAGGPAQYKKVLADTLALNPDLSRKLSPDTNASILAETFSTPEKARNALSREPALLSTLSTDLLEKNKTVILSLVSGEAGADKEASAQIFEKLPASWKNDIKIVNELVGKNASVYALIRADFKENLGIIRSAIIAEGKGNGVLDWNTTVPLSVRERLGKTQPSVEELNAAITGASKKDIKKPTTLDDIDAADLKGIKSERALQLMKTEGSVPVLKILIEKDADIIKNPEFLLSCIDQDWPKSDVFTYLTADSVTLDKLPAGSSTKLILDAINKHPALFAKLPDAKKTDAAIVKPLLDKIGTRMLSLENFGSPQVFAQAIDGVILQLLPRRQNEIAKLCNQEIYNALSPASQNVINTFRLDLITNAGDAESKIIGISAAIAAGRATPELTKDLTQIEAEDLLEVNPAAFEFLPKSLKEKPDILEAMLAKSKTLPQKVLSQINDTVRVLAEDKSNDYIYRNNQRPNVTAKYEDMIFLRDSIETTKQTVANAKFQQIQFNAYATEIQKLPNMPAATFDSWLSFMKVNNPAGINGLIASQDTKGLNELTANLNTFMNVPELISKGNINWTTATLEKQLESVEPSDRVRFLMNELSVRLEKLPSMPQAGVQNVNDVMKTREYHQKNIIALLGSLMKNKESMEPTVRTDLLQVMNKNKGKFDTALNAQYQAVTRLLQPIPNR